MKKGIHTIGFAIMIGVAGLSVGCGNANNESETEQNDPQEQGTYQCPMDCEGGKTYAEPGSCPVCKMDLAEIEQS